MPLANPMPLAKCHILLAQMVGQTPWSAAGPLAGFLALFAKTSAGWPPSYNRDLA